MTEQTQTTAERLLAIIGMNYTIIHDQRGIRVGDHSKAAAIIAAEIDRLTAERDEAQRLIGIYGTSRDAVIAQLGTEIDRLTAERDGLKAALAASWPNLSAQLSEARAEVERLRPAAEAFGWWENYASNPSTTTWDIFQDAAQRARDMSFIESRAVILTDDQIDVLKRGIARAREAAKESQP